MQSGGGGDPRSQQSVSHWVKNQWRKCPHRCWLDIGVQNKTSFYESNTLTKWPFIWNCDSLRLMEKYLLFQFLLSMWLYLQPPSSPISLVLFSHCRQWHKHQENHGSSATHWRLFCEGYQRCHDWDSTAHFATIPFLIERIKSSKENSCSREIRASKHDNRWRHYQALLRRRVGYQANSFA